MKAFETQRTNDGKAILLSIHDYKSVHVVALILRLTPDEAALLAADLLAPLPAPEPRHVCETCPLPFGHEGSCR